MEILGPWASSSSAYPSTFMRWKLRQSRLPPVKLTVTKIALPSLTGRRRDFFQYTRSSSSQNRVLLDVYLAPLFTPVKVISLCDVQRNCPRKSSKRYEISFAGLTLLNAYSHAPRGREFLIALIGKAVATFVLQRGLVGEDRLCTRHALLVLKYFLCLSRVIGYS